MLIVGLESLNDSVLVIIRASRSLSTSHTSLDAGLFVTFVEEDILGLSDIRFKIGSLLYGSWESINEVVLNLELKK